MRRIVLVLGLFAMLLLQGCVSSAIKSQIQQSSDGSDQYATLVESTLNGTIAAKDGKPVSAADIAATPASVQELLTNVIRGIYIQRRGWHQAGFAAGTGPDPATLKLDPPALPGTAAPTPPPPAPAPAPVGGK